MEVKVGDHFKSKNGLEGTIEDINGVLRLVVRNPGGRITQTLSPRKLDLNKFEKVK